MVADFRQFYGMDIPVLDGEEFDDLPRCALLWSALPRESRCARLARPDLAWSDAEHMLHSIEYSMRVLVWMGSRDGEKNRNRPKPWDTPGQLAEGRRRADSALAHRAEIDAVLGMQHG